MSKGAWSFCLQWSRVGIGALVFLIAARHLSLAEIGAFAAAYAPIRLTQGIHKAGISETVIIRGNRPGRLDTLFWMSVTSGVGLSLAFLAAAYVIAAPMFALLAIIPALNALGAVPDGLLRKNLRIRDLALRTLVSHSLAALTALCLLFSGWGAWSLVAFAILNALFANGVSCLLAGWAPKGVSSWRKQSLILPKTAQIALRDLLGTAQFPLAQLFVTLAFGLAAGGAFQIATRMVSLIDAIAVAPLRYLALPQLAAARRTSFRRDLTNQLRLIAPLSAWIWGATFAAAPHILALAVGPDHATAATPILRGLTLFGLCTALTMPVTQALTALGHTRLVLTRSFLLLSLTTICAIPTISLSATYTAAALSLGTTLTSIWYVRAAAEKLNLSLADVTQHLPALVSGVVMAAGLMSLEVVITNNGLAALTLQFVIGTALFAALLRLQRRTIRT